MKKLSRFLLGAAMGGVLGAVAATLLAPTSGKNFQVQLRSMVQNIISEIESAASEKRLELEDELKQLRSPQA